MSRRPSSARRSRTPAVIILLDDATSETRSATEVAPVLLVDDPVVTFDDDQAGPVEAMVGDEPLDDGRHRGEVVLGGVRRRRCRVGGGVPSTRPSPGWSNRCRPLLRPATSQRAAMSPSSPRRRPGRAGSGVIVAAAGDGGERQRAECQASRGATERVTGRSHHPSYVVPCTPEPTGARAPARNGRGCASRRVRAGAARIRGCSNPGSRWCRRSDRQPLCRLRRRCRVDGSPAHSRGHSRHLPVVPGSPPSWGW